MVTAKVRSEKVMDQIQYGYSRILLSFGGVEHGYHCVIPWSVGFVLCLSRVAQARNGLTSELHIPDGCHEVVLRSFLMSCAAAVVSRIGVGIWN